MNRFKFYPAGASKKRFAISLLITLFLGVNIPASAASISQLAAKLKKAKGTKAFSLTKEMAKLTPGSKEEIYLLFELIKENDGSRREELIKSVGRVNNSELNPLFVKELSNPHPMIQAVAAGMCGKLKLIAAEKGLTGIIKESPLIEGFPDTDQERATITAVLALGELRRESSLDLLLSLIGTMKGYEVQAIRKFGVKPLAKLLEIIKNPESGSDAKMAAVQVVMAVNDKAAVPLLKKEADDVKSKARPYAITILLKLSAEEYLPYFISVWEKKPDLLIESRLLYYINNWRLGEAQATTFLVKVLKDSPQTEHRRMAVTALSRIKSDASSAALKRAAKDKDKKVSLYAAQALKMRDSSPKKTKSE